MHYRTPRVSFLETAEEFLPLMDRVERFEEPRFETAGLPVGGGPVAVIPAVP